VSFDLNTDSGQPRIGFCALAYKSHDHDDVGPNIESVIVIITRSRRSDISIRVHPYWRRIASSEDVPTLQALFDDFKERAKLDSEGLLQQLSALSVGPLVTFDAGQELAERPDLRRLFHQLVEI
jgi:hypothetical protein